MFIATSMKLIKTKSYQGYKLKEVSKFMDEHGLRDKWNEWYMGSTGGIIKGEFIVYKWDFDRFMEGKSNLD